MSVQGCSSGIMTPIYGGRQLSVRGGTSSRCALQTAAADGETHNLPAARAGPKPHLLDAFLGLVEAGDAISVTNDQSRFKHPQ